MEYSIILCDEAKQDILEITKWYDLKSIGLGDRFIEYLDEAVSKLSKNPGAYSFLYDEVRKIRLKKFPYIIFYKTHKQGVLIYGIIHTKRNPFVYKKRLKKLS
ncbi:MAG: type II toxin-antitoxin system RelE/ParE family toxin [Parafilimonas sp.]